MRIVTGSGVARAAFSIFLLLVSPLTLAGSVIDYIRNYDLNDYALGVAFTASQNPYIGGERSGFAYPYLTSFRDIEFTDDWLILSGGDIGARWISKSGWILGGVGRIRTRGTGNSAISDVFGIDTRNWTVEVAPLIGWRGWPVHISYKHYVEVFDEHGGSTDELEFSFPMERDWGYVVPTVTALRFDAAFNQYYFGVPSLPLIPGIEPYAPGASNGIEVGVRWGYAIREKWLLSGYIGHEWLGSEVSDSPIVERDGIWSARIGLAYNANMFQSREYDDYHHKLPTFELYAGLFQDNVDSKMIRRPVDGGPSEEIDIEDVLGVASRQSVWQIDAVYRFNPFHRLEAGHFEIGRDSSTRLETDLEIGDQVFPAGTEVVTRSNSRVTRIAYAFSLMNDAQKELGLMAGVHITKVETEIRSESPDQLLRSTVSTPLPVVGVFGSVSIGRKTTLGARLQIFRMEFDHYAGSLNYLYIGLKHNFTQHIGAGIGYSYYDMNLDSSEEELRGSLRIRHNGPSVFASFFF